jgi:hypothetical protein
MPVGPSLPSNLEVRDPLDRRLSVAPMMDGINWR